MIPILIRWAKLGQTDRTYADMNRDLGYDRFSGIGKQLEYVENVIKALSESSGQKIPSLNALCKKTSTGLPSSGFSYVCNEYNSLSRSSKVIMVDGLNAKATKYQKWDWVLQQLELKPAKIYTDEELDDISRHSYGIGGEGKEHKDIKKYIAQTPLSVGLKSVLMVEEEYELPSGDRLDLFFKLKNGNRIAIEVKPSTSPDNDIARGIFQCVKYKAIMDAIRTIDCGSFDNVVVLVIAGKMSKQNKQLAEALGVKYIEEFVVR